jgi:hypothetical protein
MVGWPKFSHLDVVGHYGRAGFLLYLNPRGRSLYRPRLRGRIRWDGTRTRISCAMEPPAGVPVFVVAWCVLAFLTAPDMAVALANILEDPPSEADVSALGTLALLAFSAGVIYLGRWQTRHEHQELFDFVEGILDAEVEKVVK